MSNKTCRCGWSSALVAVAAALLVLLAGGPASAVYWCGGVASDCPCGATNPYPCCDNGNGKSGNCTWGAWHMACCKWGLAFPPPWQHAKYWAGNYASHPNYEVYSSPYVDAVGCRKSGDYGHVAYVTSVNGGSVTVTEQGCCEVSPCWPNCSWCANGFKTSTVSAGNFDGGYIVKKGSVWVCTPGQQESAGCGNCGVKHRGCNGSGQWDGWGPCEGQGPCSPGQANSESCGDCGSHVAVCNGGCNWDPFSSCEGPDPDGGKTPCDSGKWGVCAEGRLRCLGGWVGCAAVVDPSEELCDGLDNDCDGSTDDSFPEVMGKAPPPYAATLVDWSYPQVMAPGQTDAGWVDFRNDGAMPWNVREVWLQAEGAKGGASELAPAGAWPAWDTAALLEEAVPPGGTGRFEFRIRAPDGHGRTVVERFYLVDPAGYAFKCPQPQVEVCVQVISPTPSVLQPADAGAGQAADSGASGTAEAEPRGPGGCAAAASASCSGCGGWSLLVLAMGFLSSGLRARRNTT